MQSRVMEINLGDHYGDGHGRYETFKVTISGDDVSNEALKSSYVSMCKKMGVDLDSVLYTKDESYYSTFMSKSSLQNALDNGFDGDIDFSDEEVPGIYVDKDSEKRTISSLDLLMFYVGSEIENFSWNLHEKEKEPDLLDVIGAVYGYEFYMEV